MQTTNSIWYEDPRTFLSRYNITSPASHMSLAEKLNSVLRFTVYLGISLSIMKSDASMMVIPVIAMVVTAVVYETQRRSRKKLEEFEDTTVAVMPNGKMCTVPTEDNPYMNRLPFDDPDKPPACDPNDVETQSAIDKKFWSGTSSGQDTRDAFNRNHFQRNFHTMPNTDVIPDRDTFAKALMGDGIRDCNRTEVFNQGNPWLDIWDKDVVRLET